MATYGEDTSGAYKVRDDGSKVYKNESNAQYFPDNYGGSAGWSYSGGSSGGSVATGSSGGGGSSGSGGSSPTYGQDTGGTYKIRPDGSKVYMNSGNAQYFPGNLGGGAGWNYSPVATTAMDLLSKYGLDELLRTPEFDEDAYLKKMQQLYNSQIAPLLAQIENQNRLTQESLKSQYNQSRKDLVAQGGAAKEGITNVMALQGLTGEPMGKALANVAATVGAQTSKLSADEIRDINSALADVESRKYQLQSQAAAQALSATSSRADQEASTAENRKWSLADLVMQMMGIQNESSQNALSNRRLDEAAALDLEKWNAYPESQDWYLPLYKESLTNKATTTGSSGGSSGGGLTSTEIKTNNLADAYEAIDAALEAGKTLEEIEASIRSQTADLTRQGVDPNKLISYLQTRAMDYTPEEAVNPLKQRPWWKQAIDTFVPGSQYR